MRSHPTFSPDQHTRFQSLTAALRRQLPRTQADSAIIFECACHFLEIRDQRYYLLDEAGGGDEACDEWMRRTFGVGQRQAQKFFRIAARLGAEEVAGKSQGIEAMDQLALAPPELRPRMWELAQEERLSAGALSAGRLAAAPLLRRSPARALLVLEKMARRRAEQEVAERTERRAGPRLTRNQRIARALGREADRLERILSGEAALLPADGEALHRELGIRCMSPVLP